MKRQVCFLLMCIAALTAAPAQPVADGTMRGDVKSVQLYLSGAEQEMPVLRMEGDDRMTLEFDVLKAEPEALQWRIAHCDRDWHRDDLEPNLFLNGLSEGAVDEYDFSFTTRVDYVHYRAVVPGQWARFTHSGNYVLEVWGDEGTLLTRRFCVSEQAVRLEASVVMPYDGIDRDRRQQVDVRLSATDTRMPLRREYTDVVVMQNRLDASRRHLEFSGFQGQALCYQNRSANIFYGGNTFRYFDLSNMHTPMYNVARIDDLGGRLTAMIRPDEVRSGKHYLGEKSLMGGMKVNIWDRENPRLEADYVWVTLSLPMQQPLLDGEVHVVGALTDWHIDTTSRMEYNPRLRAYTAQLQLKQGYYAYQLLVKGLGLNATRSMTARIEGDHRETPNQYAVFVYSRTPSDRADRMIGMGYARP